MFACFGWRHANLSGKVKFTSALDESVWQKVEPLDFRARHLQGYLQQTLLQASFKQAIASHGMYAHSHLLTRSLTG